MGEKLRKFQVLLTGINSSKRVSRMWRIMKEVVVQDLRELMKTLKKCGI
jgi:sugar diacid utilization regulator